MQKKQQGRGQGEDGDSSGSDGEGGGGRRSRRRKGHGGLITSLALADRKERMMMKLQDPMPTCMISIHSSCAHASQGL